MDVFTFLVMLVVLPFVLVVFAQILKKAGFSPWLCLLIVFPLIGVIVLIVLAFVEWPTERELAWLRLKDGMTSPELIPPVERYALRLERGGDWKKAVEVYERLSHVPSVEDNGEYYRNCVKRLKEHLDL